MHPSVINWARCAWDHRRSHENLQAYVMRILKMLPRCGRQFCPERDATDQARSSLCPRSKSALTSLCLHEQKSASPLYFLQNVSRAALGYLFVRVRKTRLGPVVSHEVVNTEPTEPYVPPKDCNSISNFLPLPVPKRLKKSNSMRLTGVNAASQFQTLEQLVAQTAVKRVSMMTMI